VREASGLALSSRNQYLSKEEKMQSAAIYEALNAAKKLIRKGAPTASIAGYIRRKILTSIKNAKFDYASIVDGSTLEPVKRINAPVVAAVALRVGKTRLIDNAVLKP